LQALQARRDFAVYFGFALQARHGFASQARHGFALRFVFAS